MKIIRPETKPVKVTIDDNTNKEEEKPIITVEDLMEMTIKENRIKVEFTLTKKQYEKWQKKGGEKWLKKMLV